LTPFAGGICGGGLSQRQRHYQWDALSGQSWLQTQYAFDRDAGFPGIPDIHVGQQFEYQFDQIGNRKTVKTGGEPLVPNDVWNYRRKDGSIGANGYNQMKSRTAMASVRQFV
jgi:hypothetical protein